MARVAKNVMKPKLFQLGLLNLLLSAEVFRWHNVYIIRKTF